jgi:hypothetical protein
VNGKVIPIKDKDPSSQQIKKNYKKFGDGANQSSRIESKYATKGFNTSKTAKFLSGAGALSMIGGFLTKGKKSGALFGAGFASVVGASIAGKKNQKKYDVLKEKEYVRTFGTTSDGKRPSKNKTGV